MPGTRAWAPSFALWTLVAAAGCSDASPPKDAVQSPADFGDAPDSSNSSGVQMTAYLGVSGQFPTAAVPAGDARGPFHRNARLHYVLGRRVSLEAQAETGTDDDGENNIQPNGNAADGDGSDDGFSVPSQLPHCTRVALRVAVTALDAGQPFPERALLNVWMDFDRSGSWGQQFTCAGGVVASEWAVRDFAVDLTGPGTRVIDLPEVSADERTGNIWSNRRARTPVGVGRVT